MSTGDVSPNISSQAPTPPTPPSGAQGTSPSSNTTPPAESALLSAVLTGTDNLTQSLEQIDDSLEEESGSNSETVLSAIESGDSSGGQTGGGNSGQGENDSSTTGASAGILQIGESAAGQSEQFYISSLDALAQAQNDITFMKEYDSQLMATTSKDAANMTIDAAKQQANIYDYTAMQSFTSAGTTLAGVGMGYMSQPSSQEEDQTLEQTEYAKQGVAATKTALSSKSLPENNNDTAANNQIQINKDREELAKTGDISPRNVDGSMSSDIGRNNRLEAAVTGAPSKDVNTWTVQADKNYMLKTGDDEPSTTNPITQKCSSIDEFETRKAAATPSDQERTQYDAMTLEKGDKLKGENTEQREIKAKAYNALPERMGPSGQTAQDRTSLLKEGRLKNQGSLSDEAIKERTQAAKASMSDPEKEQCQLSCDKADIKEFGHIRSTVGPAQKGYFSTTPGKITTSREKTITRTNAAVDDMSEGDIDSVKKKLPAYTKTTNETHTKALESRKGVSEQGTQRMSMITTIANAIGQGVGGSFNILMGTAALKKGQDEAAAAQYQAVMSSAQQMFSSVNQQSTEIANEQSQASSSQASISQGSKV